MKKFTVRINTIGNTVQYLDSYRVQKNGRTFSRWHFDPERFWTEKRAKEIAAILAEKNPCEGIVAVEIEV